MTSVARADGRALNELRPHPPSLVGGQTKPKGLRW